MAVKTIFIKMIIATDESNPAQTVMEMICEVFGKEEMKDKPRAKLILIEVEEK